MKRNLIPTATFLLVIALFGARPHSVEAASVVVNVPESSALVKAGDRVYFSVEFLYPTNVGRHDFTIVYTVKEGDTVLASAQVIKAVETQASFDDYLVVPPNAKKGLHTLSVNIMDDTGAVIASGASDSFQVKSMYDWAVIQFGIILFTIVVMGVVVIIEVRHAVWRALRARA